MQVSWPSRYTWWLALVACMALGACGGSDDDDGDTAVTTTPEIQTISFQEPEDPGTDPFTPPADVEGSTTVQAEQPFGGSGSNRVCDRDKLIEFLAQNPEQMAEWARVLGVDPDIKSVKKYVAKLHPVTLTRDTQVTNHSFTNGRAVPFQAILQAGTAVLVDEYGVPVVRCYCGNPLTPAVHVPEARCAGCPPNYEPPRQCEYGRKEKYDKTYYDRQYYSNGDYDEIFIISHRSSPYAKCYKAYPDPPVVTAVNIYDPSLKPEPVPEPEPAPVPEPEPEPTGLQCDPPRSQLEAEQCAELEGTAPEPAPEPEPEPAPTDICNDGFDNEGEPGLIDGEDPNCQ